MRRRRTIASLALLASLVLGALVAPLAHLTWMQVTAPAQGGHGSGMHAPMAQDGQAWSTPEDCPDECPYLQLLQSGSSGLSVAETSAPATPARSLVFQQEGRFAPTGEQSQHPARGPPEWV